MSKCFIKVGLVSALTVLAFTSCQEEQDFTNENVDATRVQVNTISEEMAKVRDYVPMYAVMAPEGLHSGDLRKPKLHGDGPERWVPTTLNRTSSVRRTA